MIELLNTWYLAQVNGDWEHKYGISLETLDNPGWKLEITGADERKHLDIYIDNDDDDWFFVKANEHSFTGTSSPNQLNNILQLALNWLCSQEEV